MGEQTEKEITTMDELMKAVNGEFYDGKTETVTPPKEETVELPKEEPTEEESKKEPEVSNEVYVPNTKYKVKDQELEFDSRLVSVVKSKEDEEYIRDLYTKAGGLDTYKEKLEKEAKRIAEYETQMAEVAKQIEESNSFYSKLVESRDKKQFRTLAKTLGMSEDDLLTAALEIATERELPEQERNIRKQNREMEERLQQTESQAMTQKQYLEQLAAERQYADAIAYHKELADKQTKELNEKITSQYSDLDNNLKELGLNLFDEVVLAGKHIFDSNGRKREVTTEEALNAAVAKYAKLATIKKDEPKVKQVSRKDTLPIVSGANSSKISESPISSFDDIKKELDKIQNN